MSKMKFIVLGVGNILELDDGIAVYATSYLEKNYRFTPEIKIINGGVEGINLLNLFMENDSILILDAINIDDKPGSIYHIPSSEISGYGINSGGAHEVGVMQCIDMLELMGRPLPKSSVLGIVPDTVKVGIGLTPKLRESFLTYIDTIIKILQKENIIVEKHDDAVSLDDIIETFKNPKR
ncbi:HyaD/HybD family hydrogenase maturation endopeptidase [Sulfurimonas sp. HSL-1716]|uniref:HyaD/HybD family hydrogenase maturation endopeptidase n=1 Tax=Hydrocurvibacter sulfurireducens TaxID=3131937 RepID=UPI0031F8C35D